MNHYGVGIDLVEVPRFKRIVDKRGDRFLARVFTPAELDHCFNKKRTFESLAARFAAKEAFVKAIGGWNGLGWKQIEVKNKPSGQPYLEIHGDEQSRFGTIHLSLTHTERYAIAQIVVVRSEP
ncbi:MAG: holo-ACP synthase [Candidatus Bipolaricaulia bacterium]